MAPLLSQYYCSHIVPHIVISIYYYTISVLMLSSFNSILLVFTVVAHFIVLNHTDAYKPVLILVVCFTYLFSIFHTILFHVTYVYCLRVQDSSFRYPLALTLKLVYLVASSDVYKTRLLASLQIVKDVILTAFALCCGSYHLVVHRCLTCYPALIQAAP